MTAKNPLTESERERIAATIAAAEKRSDTNFVLAIVPVSGRYRLYAPVAGALIAVVGEGAAALLRPELGIGAGFLIAATLFLAVTLGLEWMPLRLLVVPKRVKHRRAHEFAHREFAASILASAAQKGGVLLFVSLGERYAEILADRTIDARVAQGTWDRIVADFVAAVKADRLAEGCAAAIEACAAALGTQKP